jgi:carbonic anhydrase
MLAKSQDPFAAVLCCADSRVVPEIVFDAGLGELFVIRVAGNVANVATIASLEYAVAVLGVKLLMIMAHGNCGAVTAALAGSGASDNLQYLLDYIQPAVERSERANVDEVARLNAKLNAERMLEESEIVRQAVDSGDVRIVTVFYDPGTGEANLI